MTATQPPDSFEGFAVPPGRYRALRLGGPGYRVTLGLWAALLATVMMVLAVIGDRAGDLPTRYVCPPDCGRPPTGQPVATNPRFEAPGGEYSVSYPAPGAAYTVTTGPDGVVAEFTGGDGGVMRLFGRAAAGRSAQQIVAEVITTAFPDARTEYELPNATVGYQPGHGEVANFQPPESPSTSDRIRIIVIAAVKNDFALIAAAAGPFHRFTPEFGPGPPSPANLQIAQDMGKYVNSFAWRGDPPR